MPDQPNPEPLARVLASAEGINLDHTPFPLGMTRYWASAKRILADPSPLLAALAEAGALETDERVEPCDEQCEVWSHYAGAWCGHRCRQSADHAGAHECVDGHTFERGRGEVPGVRDRRYVTGWRPADA